MNNEINQSLSDWNPWFTGDFPKELMGQKRGYNLIPYLEVPEIKIIEGARRVGKSTLLYQVIYEIYQKNKNFLYINFEDEILRKYSLSDIFYAYQKNQPIEYLFVDEIQNCIDWVQFVRKMYDRHEIKQLWVSGSNASLIKQEYATLLTGRNLPIHIFPLSFSEFLTFKNFSPGLPLSRQDQTKCLQLFSEFMEYGAFPAIVNRTVLKKELLIAYFDDFIYKDIVSRHHVNPSKIKDLAIYLATNSCKAFSYRNVAGFLKCHFDTVVDYVGYLKTSFLFEELHKFDYSLQKQFTTDKKIYCLDTGLASAVSFRFSEDKGRILENIIFCELKRRHRQIYFHKDKTECDFVIKEELQITQAIQVCLSLEDPKTRERELNGLLDALEIYNLEEGLILTYNEEDTLAMEYKSKTYHIKIVPAWKWLLQ